MKSFRGYIFSRRFMAERAPQHIQNLVLRDYCARNGFNYLLSATEYAMADCHMILEQVLDELPSIDGIVAYSLFLMPVERQRRIAIYDRVLGSGKEMHFAVEGLQLSARKDVQRLEDIWLVSETLPSCISSLTGVNVGRLQQ